MLKKISLLPLHDRVIVLPDEAEKVSAGGIVIPDTAKEVPKEGYVVASGPGTKDLPNQTKFGDRVLFGKYAGQEVEYDGITYLFMRESDILSIDSGPKQKPKAETKKKN